MSPALVAHLALAMAAPSFDAFLSRAAGKWSGASYCWQRRQTESPAATALQTQIETLPLQVAPGFITVPTPASTEVVEVMRSCGGAVQGVEELRKCQPADGSVKLNRDVDGTSFFATGSWSTAPTLLSDAEESDMLASPGCFGMSACLSHDDATRRRLLVVIADSQIECCDVAIERLDSSYNEDVEPDVADQLLGMGGGVRLRCIVEAKAWEGGASTLTLSGVPPAPAAGWLNARTKWTSVDGALEGGAPLVPPPTASEESEGDDVAHLPGGCWVRVRGDARSELLLEVGSVSPEAAESVSITHEYTKGALSKVTFSKVTFSE